MNSPTHLISHSPPDSCGPDAGVTAARSTTPSRSAISAASRAHFIPGDEDRVRDAIDRLPMALTAEVAGSPKLATLPAVRSGKISGR